MPTDRKQIEETLLQGLGDDFLEKWEKSIYDGSLYKRMVKDAFLGMVAIKALGGLLQKKIPLLYGD